MDMMTLVLGRTLRSVVLFIVAAAVQALACPASAMEVDLELVLAVDVSASIDEEEARQQRGGYITALAHPDVIAAIQAGPRGRIALAYVEWAGATHQHVVAGWAIVDSAESAAHFAAILARAPIGGAPGTSISAAIDFARQAFARNGHEGARRVIDISGDGPNSDGRPVEAARDAAVLAGITINGLPLLSLRPNPGGGAPATGVYRHYAEKVIGGPGAFLMPAQAFDDLATALVEKLTREIRGDVPLSLERGRSPQSLGDGAGLGRGTSRMLAERCGGPNSVRYAIAIAAYTAGPTRVADAT